MWTLSSISGVGLSSRIIWKSRCTGEKYVSFLSLHSNGVAGCSAPLASRIVGRPKWIFFILITISLSKTSSLMIPPSSSSTGSSVPIRMLRTIFSIRLNLPSDAGIQSL